MSDEAKNSDEEQPAVGQSEASSPSGTDERNNASSRQTGDRYRPPVWSELIHDNPGTPSRHGREIWKGIGLAALLHLLPLIFPALYFGIGLVQIVYIVPAIILCRKNTGMMQGLLIAAGITFLLNAACFGWVFISFNH